MRGHMWLNKVASVLGPLGLIWTYVFHFKRETKIRYFGREGGCEQHVPRRQVPVDELEPAQVGHPRGHVQGNPLLPGPLQGVSGTCRG